MSTPYIPPMEIVTIGSDSSGRKVHGTLSDSVLDAKITEKVAPVVNASANQIRRSAVPPMGIAFLTDSIGAFQSNTGQAWHRIMCTLSRGRLMWRGYFGTGGFTLEQIRETHLPQILAMSPLPGAVAICGGTNNVGSATFDEASSRATLVDIIAKLEASGIKPVLWTLPPRNDSTAVNTLVQRWNVWVRYLAGAKNLALVDSHSVFVDPATSLAPTVWYGTSDGVHPNRLGHFLLGKAMANDLRFMEHFPTNGVYLSASKGSDPSLVPANARFFDAGVNGNTAPLNWTTVGFPAACAGSQIDDAAVPGNWFRMTKTAGLAGSAIIRQEYLSANGSFAIGETVAFSAMMKLSSQDDQTGATAGMLLEFRTESALISIVNVFGAGGLALDGIGYMEAVVPAGCTRIRATLTFDGTPTVDSWVQFAQPTFLNLSKLGIA